MNGLNFVKEDEVLKSASFIDDYVVKEVGLLERLSDNLRYGFGGTYSSDNYNRITSKCTNLKRHSYIVTDNNKKISGTLKDVCILYKSVARKEASKLEDARREF